MKFRAVVACKSDEVWQGTFTAAMKPLIDQMEEVKSRLQQYKPPHRSRSKLNWKSARNKRRYCKFGDECNRQNHDGPDCFWRHGGHLKNSVLCLPLSTASESQDRTAPRSGGVCFCNKTPTLLFCGSGPRFPPGCRLRAPVLPRLAGPLAACVAPWGGGWS